ncbi:conserved hypothetical protein [Vibrio crassostreae]|nr:conserved hypothetical protein [Vibrio crassostreae]CAK2347665.1 conserved hypothetical protein [Vibrio crassostreae]CAK2527415.1 conserved hypothetical protein [Vibrio crassostreae]CAK2989969.1 conserved hypothetical protein [Vibrio crassostreae]
MKCMQDYFSKMEIICLKLAALKTLGIEIGVVRLKHEAVKIEKPT